MKITSRSVTPTVHNVTPVQIQDIRVDCDTTYMGVSNMKVMSKKDFYVEVRLRIALTDEDIADINVLGERIRKLQQAQLLEVV